MEISLYNEKRDQSNELRGITLVSSLKLIVMHLPGKPESYVSLFIKYISVSLDTGFNFRRLMSQYGNVRAY